MQTHEENVAASIAMMDRYELQKELLRFQGSFKLDFTQEYLQSQTLERLRHILLAAKLQQSANN